MPNNILRTVSIFPKSQARAEELQSRRSQACLPVVPSRESCPLKPGPTLARLVQNMELLESMDDLQLSIHNANERNKESMEQMLPPATTSAFRGRFYTRTLTESAYMGSVFSDKVQKELLPPYFDALARFEGRFGGTGLKQLQKTFPFSSIFSDEFLGCALKRDSEGFVSRIGDLAATTRFIRYAVTILNYLAETISPENIRPYLENLESPWPRASFSQSVDKTSKFAAAIESGSVPELLELVAELRRSIKEEEEERMRAQAERAERGKARKAAKEAFRQSILALGNRPAMLAVFEFLRIWNRGDPVQYKEFKSTLGSDEARSCLLATCESLSFVESGKTFRMLLDRYRRAKAGMLTRASLNDYWEGLTTREELEAGLGTRDVKIEELSESAAKIYIAKLDAKETISREGVGAAISSHLRSMAHIRYLITIELWHRYDEMTTGEIRRYSPNTWRFLSLSD